MKITFDPAKRAATLADRGIDFLDAEKVFETISFTQRDDRFDYGEERYQTYGLLNDRLVTVVWTPRGEARHVISMRKCNDKEKTAYGHRLGKGGRP
jgi:uncharacterized DUF497 family protein